MKLINHSVPHALRTLGYSESDIIDIVTYAAGHDSLAHCPNINITRLRDLGVTDIAMPLTPQRVWEAIRSGRT